FIATVSLVVGVWARETGRPWQSMLFLVLGATQLGVALGSRARPGTLANPFLLVAVGAALALQVAGVYLPPLRQLLGTEPLAAADLVIAFLLSGLGHVVMRLQTRLRPERHPGTAPHGPGGGAQGSGRGLVTGLHDGKSDETRRLRRADRKSTRLNSSHVKISYAVFCWKEKREAFQYLARERGNSH